MIEMIIWMIGIIFILPINAMAAPRVLIVRFSAIGDCVMAAWAATSIRQRYPDGFLCWAVEARCAAVIERKELTSQVWELPRDRWKRSRWSPKIWAEQLAAYSRLRRLNLDIGIDLQGHSKTAVCLRLSGAKLRISGKATDAVAARLNPLYGQRPQGVHVVEWNQKVLSAVGEFQLPDLPIMPRRHEAVEAVRQHLRPDRRLATISVGAGQPDKAYPAEKWREVAEALLLDGYQVAYLGGPADSPIVQEGTVDLVGKLPLTQTLAAVQCSDLHLAGDTGTGHMAAACGIPVVSVFGPTDPDVFRPFTTNGLVLREGRETALVSPERVVRAARELVRREGCRGF